MKKGEPVDLDRAQRVEILRMLRGARALILRDHESFHTAALVLEHIGQIIGKKVGNGLDAYQNEILNLAAEAPQNRPENTFMLWETVRLARNDIVHGGAYVRHLSDRLVELIIGLEDAVMSKLLSVQDIMVRDVSVAAQWQNIAHARRVMLSNAFSYLPIQMDNLDWKLVPVFEIVRFLKQAVNKEHINKLLAMKLSDAMKENENLAIRCESCRPEIEVSKIIAEITEVPVLVFNDGDSKKELQGIVTSFDLLSYSATASY